MSIELFSDVVDLSNVQVEEALEDGSFSYTDGNSPTAELKLVVRGAFEAYPAYMAVVNYLQRTYGDENGYITMCNIPLDTIRLNKLACDFAYTAECSFQFEEDSTGNNDDGSSNSRDSNRRGTSSNNPVINDENFQMPEIQSSDFQYANTGGTMHLTHAYKQDYYYLSPETSGYVNHFGGVNGTEDGTYEGVDVACPSEVFSVTVSAPNYWLTSYYRTLITGCTGCTNADPFWGYAPECVLFKGISASPVALNYTNVNGDAVKSWYWRIKFEFEARRGTIFEAPTNMSWTTGTPLQDKAKISEKITETESKLKSSPCNLTAEQITSLTGIIESDKFLTLNSFTRIVSPNTFPVSMKKQFVNCGSLLGKLVALKKAYNGIPVNGSIYKPGFKYIWFSNPKRVTDSNGEIVSNYLQANLAQVYPTADFSILNLPELSDAD